MADIKEDIDYAFTSKLLVIVDTFLDFNNRNYYSL